MEIKEAVERFNALPKESRVTIIASELHQQIRWLDEEKRNYIKEHKLNLERINKRIKGLENHLKDLKD